MSDIEEDILDIDGDNMRNKREQLEPTRHIDIALLGCKEALLKENMQQGFIQYVHLVEHIEKIAEATNMLPEEYYTKVSEYKETEEFKEEKDLNKIMKLARFKLGLLLKEIFSSGEITGAGLLGGWTQSPKKP